MYDSEEAAEFDAYEPNDPKNPAYVDRILDVEPELDDRPPMSPLGQWIFGLAAEQNRVYIAGMGLDPDGQEEGQ